ncbi:MAG: GNAT family protein [Bacteroidota bacterium]
MITTHPIAPNQQLTKPTDPQFIQEIEEGTKGYYLHIGFTPPWNGYLFKDEDQWIGTGGFKGAPANGRVELAYAVLPEMEGTGYGTIICAQLIEIAQSTDPGLRICARTLPEKNASGRILLKNSFKKLGAVKDEEDGEVWEWQYLP